MSESERAGGAGAPEPARENFTHPQPTTAEQKLHGVSPKAAAAYGRWARRLEELERECGERLALVQLDLGLRFANAFARKHDLTSRLIGQERHGLFIVSGFLAEATARSILRRRWRTLDELHYGPLARHGIIVAYEVELFAWAPRRWVRVSEEGAQ